MHTVARQFQLSRQTSANDVHCDVVHNTKRFAVGLSDGSVQIWDQRKSVHQLKFQAHDRETYALEWHPRLANVLATGSRDNYIKVWRVDNSVPKTPLTTIATGYQINRVKWRPDHRYQIMSCSKRQISIWNIKRPFMPVAHLLHKSSADLIDTTDVEWLLPPTTNSVANDGRSTKFCRSVVISSSDRASAGTGNVSLHDPREAYRPFEGMRNRPIVADHVANITCSKFSYNLSDERLDYEYENDPDSDPDMNTDLDIAAGEHVNGAQPLFNISGGHNDTIQTLLGNPALVVTLALQYRLRGDTVFNLCKHNASVAAREGRAQVAAAWGCLQNMYRDLNPRDDFAVAVRPKTAEVPAKGKPTGFTDSDTTEILKDIKGRCKTEASASEQPTPTRAADINSVSTAYDCPPWFKDARVEMEKSLILSFADNSEDDIQTAVSFICVLVNGDADRGDSAYPLWLDSLESRIPAWFEHYTDVLERYKLQTTILEVLTLGSPSVALPDFLQALCPQKNVFGKITITKPKSGELPFNLCTICQVPVRRRLYVWCQGCGHGGHIDCMKDWFKDYVFCPSGCGHVCDYGAIEK